MKPVLIGLRIAAALGGLIVAPDLASHRVLSAQAKSQAFLIANVRVFDGERARPNMNVVVEDGVIRAVDSTRDKWSRLPAIDGSGATLLPGFIDAHTHPRAESDLQDALRFGVTAVLDMGLTSAITDQRVLRAAAVSRVDVADYRSAGIFATSPGGHGTQFGVTIPTVAGAADAESFVEARKASSAEYLKIILNGVRTASSGVPNMTEDTAST